MFCRPDSSMKDWEWLVLGAGALVLLTGSGKAAIPSPPPLKEILPGKLTEVIPTPLGKVISDPTRRITRKGNLSGDYSPLTNTEEVTARGSRITRTNTIRTSSGGVSNINLQEQQKIEREGSLVTIDGKQAVPIRQSDGTIAWQSG